MSDRREQSMQLVGVRRLSRDTRAVIEQLLVDRQPLVVTKDGKAVAVLTCVDDQEAAAIALGVVPELIQRREEAVGDISAGRGQLLSEMVAEFDEDLETQAAVDRTDFFGSADLKEWDSRSLAAASVSAAGVPDEIQFDRRIQELNTELVSAYVADFIPDILRRITFLNEEIAAEVNEDDEPLDPMKYLEELEHVTALQLRLLRSQAPDIAFFGKHRNL